MQNTYITMEQSLNTLFADSFRKYWDNKAFTDYKGNTLTYGEAALAIHKIHHLFQLAGINQGDKVALLGRNSSSWCIIYLATISYGAVIVPILPDFGMENTQHILNHSDSVLLFTSASLFEKIDAPKINCLKGVISIELDEVLYGNMKGELPNIIKNTQEFNALRTDIVLPELNPELPAVISYTSGTSGFSKGVVIPLRSIYSNVLFATQNIDIVAGDRFVSFLPLAHAYGCLFEFLFPVAAGCHITFLTKTPTPTVVMEAFQEIKPRLILSVPLVIEKIYSKKIQPLTQQSWVQFALRIPIIKTIILSKIHSKLMEAFGGNFIQIVIGGAPLTKSVEAFFTQVKFPFTIGYGMTECGPLISYAQYDKHKVGGAGKMVDRMECKIMSKDPTTIPGEILVRGANTMLGYYKDEKNTNDVLSPDGWLKTGDLGIMDGDGYLFIRGRNKSMILGASGQNIYPEEIETVLNHETCVGECLVRSNKGKLEALIYPNFELVAEKRTTKEELYKKIESLKAQLNKKLPSYAQIGIITIVEEEFVKTPKRSIKRYLYNIEETDS